jgi:hypothetical protein
MTYKTPAITILTGLILTCLGCGEEVKMVEVEPMTIEFKKTTGSEPLKVKALDMRGIEIKDVPFTYSSEDGSVAMVTGDGVVKPVGDGSTYIVARTPQGITGEVFVKVCLPNELICDPGDELKLKVGTTGPIKCEVRDCAGDKVQSKIEFKVSDEEVARPYEDDYIFVGLKVGDTHVVAKAFTFEKQVRLHVDEQEFLPGMEPGAGGGGGGGGKKKGGDGDTPYGSSQYDHILSNMKFD